VPFKVDEGGSGQSQRLISGLRAFRSGTSGSRIGSDLLLKSSQRANAYTGSYSSEQSQGPIRNSRIPQTLPEALAPILRFLIGSALLLYGLSLVHAAKDGRNGTQVVGFLLTLAGSLVLFIA
jgi:hypothetical protein